MTKLHFSPKRYCIFLDDINRQRATELEIIHSTSFSGLVRHLIKTEHEKLLPHQKRMAKAELTTHE